MVLDTYHVSTFRTKSTVADWTAELLLVFDQIIKNNFGWYVPSPDWLVCSEST